MINVCKGVTAICPARLSGSVRCRLPSHSKSQLWQCSSEDEKQPSVSILLEEKRDANAYPAGLLRLLGIAVWVGSGSQKTPHNWKPSPSVPPSPTRVGLVSSSPGGLSASSQHGLELAFWANCSSWEGVRDAFWGPHSPPTDSESQHLLEVIKLSFPEHRKDQFLDTCKTYWMSQARVYNEETKRNPLI